jgi:uncharacterized protein
MDQKIIEKTIDFVKSNLEKNDASHDFSHIERVWKLAKTIWEKEKGDMFIIELWALLHDIADHKYYDWDETIWPKMAREFLSSLNVDEEKIDHIVKIIENISFSKSLDWEKKFDSIELQIIQDADMLDAIWALWIARTFTYWWAKGRKLYDPNIKPNLNMTKEEYKKSKSPTLNHFYEKLFLLKDRMNTVTWKEIAEKRHKFMEDFVEEFLQEWEGKR